MSARATLRRLTGSTRAVAAVEFALAAPMIMMLLFGVIQIGFVMHSYNSVRGVAGEVSRYAVVQYMTGNKLSDTQIENTLISQATQNPYALNGDRLDVTVTTDLANSLTGVKKVDIGVVYTPPIIVPFIPSSLFALEIDRSIYLYDQ